MAPRCWSYFLTVIAPIFLRVRFKNMVALLNVCFVYKHIHIGVLARNPVEQSNPISFSGDITNECNQFRIFVHCFLELCFASAVDNDFIHCFYESLANANPIPASPLVISTVFPDSFIIEKGKYNKAEVEE
jgi:hypothetical protein